MAKESEQSIREQEDNIDGSNKRLEPYPEYLKAELGLRNHWYAALFGNELEEGKCAGEMIMGERILFKRVDGKVYAIADRCPHRGAAFSARPECYTKNTVTCWFHGFTIDVRDGKLVQIITDPDSKLIGKLKHKTYFVEEVNGVIFVFVGDMDPPPPVKQDLQPKFLTPKLVFHPVARNKFRANWRIAAENGFDAAHLYAHRNAGVFDFTDASMPLSSFPKSPQSLEIIDEDDGPWGIVKLDDFTVWSTEIEGVTINAVNLDPENIPSADIPQETVVGIYLPCGLEVDWWPAPGVIHFEWFTPIDEDHHMYIIAHATVVNSAEEEEEFHRKCEEEYIPVTWKAATDQVAPMGDGVEWGFNNFDAFGREQIHHVYQYEDFWHQEKLIRPDVTVSKWRLLVNKRMRGIQKRAGWARTHGWSPDGKDYDPKITG